VLEGNISYHQQSVEMANYWMMIPFSLAAIIGPPAGYIIGKVGLRLTMFVMGTVFLTLAHAHFIWMPGVEYKNWVNDALLNGTNPPGPVFWNLDVPWYAHPTWPLVLIGISYMTYWNIVWSMPMFTVPDLEGIATGVLSVAANMALGIYPTFVGLLTKEEKEDPSGYVGGYLGAEVLMMLTSILCGLVCLALRIFHKDGPRLDSVDPNNYTPKHLRVKDAEGGKTMSAGLLDNEEEKHAEESGGADAAEDDTADATADATADITADGEDDLEDVEL